MKILLSGSTGLIGKYLVEELKKISKVYTISRTDQGTYKGDLTTWQGGLPVAELKKEKFDIFIHAAGLYNLRASKADLHMQNVVAINTALNLCQKAQIDKFINLSSIAAGINSPLGSCRPYDLHFNKYFPDAYAESKAQGEIVLKNYPDGPSKRLNLRLGAIVGDTKGSKIQRVDGPYHAPFAFRKAKYLIEKLPTPLLLPGSDDTYLPIVPVDVIASAIAKFSEYISTQENQFESYHLTPQIGMPLKSLYLDSLKYQAIRNNGVKLLGKVPQNIAAKVSEWLVDFPAEELAYVLKLPKYHSESTRQVLGEKWCPEYFEYEQTFWSGYEKYISNSRN